MTSPLALYLAFVGAVILERLVELVLSKRHARVLLSRGGVEHGTGHYPSMVVLHIGLLAGCLLEPLLLERRFVPAVGLPMFALVLAAQAVRWWAIRTLGVHWNTRVIVIPNAPRVSSGPYRWLRHPNYLAVVVEGIALPLVHSAWITALVFTTLNAWLLSVRLRSENAALATMAAA